MDLLWRVGAFAERFPSEARDFGRAHKDEALANARLYATAGGARPGSLLICDGPLQYVNGMTTGCCQQAPCSTEGLDTCCARGTCTEGGPDEDAFEQAYPDADAELDGAHAFAAALRDILADPNVDDVAGAMAQAMDLDEQEALAALYVPAVPAKKMPDGSDAPARCPICGALVCPTCGSTCECCDSEMT